MSPPDRDAERRAARLGPEAIARTTFPTSFRGYEPDQVRSFLDQVASELREQRDREAALRTEIEALEKRVAEASQLDEGRLTALLGEETARVLTAAREASAEIKTKATDSAARLLRDAQEEAATMRTDAETVLARRTEEADAEATRIRSDAEASVVGMRADGQRVLDAARFDAERIRAEADDAGSAAIEDAKARGREMVDEAMLVRTRVLEDLARKRRTARAQIERLQAGRERLLASYDFVRRTLDEVTEELHTSLSSAKVAADAAAHRAEGEPLPTTDELEREVLAARAAGLTVVDEPESMDESEADFEGELPQEEMVPLEPSADFEAVRVVAAEPDSVEPVVDGEVAVDGEAVEVIEVVEVVDVIDEATGEEVVEIVEIVEVVDASGEEPPGDEGDPSVNVDDLFARIRASRAADVAKAQEILADQPDEHGEQGEPDEPSEPETDVAVDATAAGSETEVATETEADDDASPAPPAPDDQALLERRDAITDEAEKQAVRKLKRVLADEQNDVLDRLRRNPKAKLDDLFPAADEHVERYAAAGRTHLVDVAKKGGGFYGDEPAKSDVSDLARELGESLTLPLRDRVDSSLREAAGDEEAMADGVRAVYRDWKTHRVASQARDTVIAAFNRGLFDATGPQVEMRWLIDDGGSPCPDAEDNSLAGLVVRGEPFPTGHCYPPAHPGCRCLLVPAPH